MPAPLPQETWEKLRDALLAGATAPEAALTVAVSVKTARRVWLHGVGGRPPVKDLAARHAEDARAELRRAAARSLAAAVVADPQVAAAVVGIEREWVRAHEAAALKASYSAAVRVMTALARLAEVVDAVMPEVVARLKAELESGELDARDAVALLDRIASIGQKAMGFFGAQQEALRTHTADLGKLEEPPAKRTKAASAEAIHRARRAAERAGRLALRVIEGGAEDGRVAVPAPDNV